MSDRKYSVSEIDALRGACLQRFDFGTTYCDTGFRVGRAARPEERTQAVEEMTRTYMLAGITAEDIYEQDRPKEIAS